MTLSEAAKATGINYHTLRKKAEQGIIPTEWVGPLRIVKLGDVEDAIAKGIIRPGKPGRPPRPKPTPTE